MGLGKIITQRCLTDPPPDPRCANEAFALANPDICPMVPRLVIRPSFALACSLGSVQFKASYFDAVGIETDVTDQTIFESSNPNIAVVGATSGNATGLSTGEASITGTYQTLSAFAELTVLGDNCCDDQNVAMMVMVDRTRSMNQPFGAEYATKLHFAKAAATRFISEVNETKDTVGLMQFTAAGYDILSPLTSDKAAVAAMIPGINQTQQLTTFYDALTAAITELNAATTAELKVIVLISDGEDKDDSYSSADNPVALLQEFKDAGGIVLCVGVRAHDFGYNLLQAFSTGGFFLNGHDLNAEATLGFMSGLKGYICAGNCTPTGDEFVATGTLNYCGLANWNVVDGHVDLMGNGFLDLLPGNGLYLDLAGSRAEFKGRLESKDSYNIEESKTYRLKLKLAGNQRVDATPNTVRVRAFARNSITLPDQDYTTAAVLTDGAGSAPLETYEYAFSYVTANGETGLTPASNATNGGFETFKITVTADSVLAALEQPVLVRLWVRELGTSKYYLIAEADPESPTFEYTYNLARLAAAIANGTVDPCYNPVEVNSTGAPIVIFEQDITIDDFTQDFTDYNLSFEAPYDAEVWLSIQQTETPAGYDATGLLLAEVTFENVTDDDELLHDDFNTENTVYVPPACGLGSNYVLLSGGYGYAYGYNCYGEGCLDEPPDVQSPDPSPLVDNEVTTPPEFCSRTADVVRSCATGYLYVPHEPLVVVSTVVSHCENETIAALDGLRWEMPVLHNCSFAFGSICRVRPPDGFCNAAAVPDPNPHPCDPPNQVVTLRGDAGITYNVTLRFRGVVERQALGVAFAGTNDCFVQLASYPGVPPANRGNVYYLTVTDPATNPPTAVVYGLNSIDGGSSAVYLIDYTVTIPINASAIVSLLSRSRDGLSNTNFGNLVVPGIVNKSTTEPAVAFPGQFIQMDVVSVVAQ